MAAQQAAAGESDDDEFHSLSDQGDNEQESYFQHHNHDEEVENDGSADDDGAMTPPIHPLPSFQAAFEESILESTQSSDKLDATDAETRRRRLLEAERYEAVVATRWKQRRGAKYHPFLKLMAQIVFGMHLLKEEQAKSNAEVIRILQNHVNEVDALIESTAEDFDLAIRDIEERTRYLKLPMQHMNLFQSMLDEKKFRMGLLNGNDKIEKIIAKTTVARRAGMLDIHHGIKATKELRRYLDLVERSWPTGNRDIDAVFIAMRGNEEGWAKYLRDLRTKGYNLKNSLVVLETVVAEISKHAAAASRRNKSQSRTVSPTTKNASSSTCLLLSKFAKDSLPLSKKPGPWLDKPLPREPNATPGAQQAAVVKPHPVSLETRYEQPRKRVPAPTPKSSQNVDSQRHRRASSADLDNRIRVEYSSNSGGLRSHPPDRVKDPAARASKSTADNGLSHSTINKQDKHDMECVKRNPYRRSRSQGDILGVIQKPTESKHVARKPVPKRDRKDEGPPSALDNKDMGTYSFRRRISHRLKALEVPKSAPTTSVMRKEVPPPRPIDSAHSSQGNRSSNDADKTPNSPDLGRRIYTSPTSAKSELMERKKSQDIGRKTEASASTPIASLLTPSLPARRDPSHIPGSDTKAYIPPNLNSSPASHQTGGSTAVHRTLSLKTFFHYRGKGSQSRNVVF